jgi:hypothetical protein
MLMAKSAGLKAESTLSCLDVEKSQRWVLGMAGLEGGDLSSWAPWSSNGAWEFHGDPQSPEQLSPLPPQAAVKKRQRGWDELPALESEPEVSPRALKEVKPKPLDRQLCRCRGYPLYMANWMHEAVHNTCDDDFCFGWNLASRGDPHNTVCGRNHYVRLGVLRGNMGDVTVAQTTAASYIPPRGDRSFRFCEGFLRMGPAGCPHGADCKELHAGAGMFKYTAGEMY